MMRARLSVACLAALAALGWAGCDDVKTPTTPAAASPAIPLAQASPAPAPPPPLPIVAPDYSELLDAAMAGPVALPAAVGATLRRLELASGDRPAAVSLIDDDEAGWPARAEALLTFVATLPEHGLRPDEDTVALVEDLERLRDEALADSRFTRDQDANHARALRGVHIEHASVALFLAVADALGALRPLPGEAKARVRGELVTAFVRWDLPEALLATLAPANAPYERLRKTLPRYRAIVEAGDFVPVPDSAKKAHPGRASDAVGPLRARLAQEDPEGAGEGEVWDEALTEALRRARTAYQLSKPSKDSALIDAALLNALAVPAAERLAAVELNLDRLRHSDLRDHPFAVYIVLPDFHGEVWDGPERLIRFKTVVGNAARRGALLVNATPELTARIDTVIYNPYWNVPPRIFQEELLRDEAKWQEKQSARVAAGDDPLPDFWESQRFEVMNADNPKSMWVRRKPGPGNALGKVKFMFENRSFVFLHDTSDKRKFRETRRAFSHGCMRVQKPLELAELLLRHDGSWQTAEDERVMEHTRETPIALHHSIPIIVEYLTARASDAGRVHFLTDIYGRDSAHIAQR